MRPLKSLTFDAVRCLLSRTFKTMPDRRAPERVRSSMHDTLVSAFARFFFQFPSLLGCQEAMKQRRGRCNLETLFGVRELPSDTQMRDVLGGTPSGPLRRLLAMLFERVRRAGFGAPSPGRQGDRAGGRAAPIGAALSTPRVSFP